MRARNWMKAAGLVAASALLIVVLTAAGLLAGPLEGKTIVKRIYVPGRIFNVVAK